ncbi:hypothetical protein QNI19_14560 [Cytophagaceae bacterium DM2B3-1]|uniref:Lysis protein n=1 Tax=Xanthocytophaga flava TaxID=3048013 RepID=A0ABT7CK97_9BACT|nr:hypothetical protein [Xanthocytophaga flavus]MDJ1494162.1 hypothetical protein [Xanthocytophaga flavus]
MHKDSTLSYVTGTLSSIFGAALFGDIFYTCMMAMLGAVVGFITTELLHYLKKNYLKKLENNGESKR